MRCRTSVQLFYKPSTTPLVALDIDTVVKNFALLLCLSASLWARSAETVFFRAVLLPSNEVPAVNIKVGSKKA